MSKGFNQSDIAKELHTTRNTIMRDTNEINEWTRKGLYDLAKQSLSTMLYSCLIGLNEVEKEAWKLYKNDDNDKNTNRWHKVYALRLLIDLCKSKFSMFESGPALLEVNRLNSVLHREFLVLAKNLQTIDKKFKKITTRSIRYQKSLSHKKLESIPITAPSWT